VIGAVKRFDLSGARFFLVSLLPCLLSVSVVVGVRAEGLLLPETLVHSPAALQVSRALSGTVTGGTADPGAAGDSLSPVETRSPFFAGVRSAVCPGWGQWYNGKRVKGAVMFLVQSFLFAGAVWQNQMVVSSRSDSEREFYQRRRNGLVWLNLAERVYSILDAYVDAHFVGFDQDIGIELPQGEGNGEPGGER